MKPSQPIVIDGETYDLLSMNLIVSSKYNYDGIPDASIATQFIPTRIENEKIITAIEGAINIQVGTLSCADQATITAAEEINASIQKYIYAKGI